MPMLTAFGQFLGQQNITNAYVSGMKEDLNAQGNELNYFVVACMSDTIYRTCWSTLTPQYRQHRICHRPDPTHDIADESQDVSANDLVLRSILTIISAPYLLPTLQITWAIIAFCQSEIKHSWHLYILRAITGFLEASSFGGTHLIRKFKPLRHSVADILSPDAA